MTYLRALVGLLVVFLILAIMDLHRRRRLRFYWSRGCAGRQWKTQFPEASNVQIREFLGIFGKAWGVSRKRRLNSRPDDKMMDIYRTRYPHPYPDFLAEFDEGIELEVFCREIQDKYDIDLWSASPQLTLGQIFAMTRKGKLPDSSSQVTDTSKG
ncbi:MAG: hypothetical protein ACLQVA_05835 [Candidatus Brocadiia bacterium]